MRRSDHGGGSDEIVEVQQARGERRLLAPSESVLRAVDAGGASVVNSHLLLDVLRLLPRFDFPGIAGSVGGFERTSYIYARGKHIPQIKFLQA